jgi:hypothetical protein
MLFPLAAILFLSGCCRVLGICTSASIHTSISPPQKVVEQRSLGAVPDVPVFACTALMTDNSLN